MELAGDAGGSISLPTFSLSVDSGAACWSACVAEKRSRAKVRCVLSGSRRSPRREFSSDSVFARPSEVKAARRVSGKAFQTCGRSGTSRPALIVRHRAINGDIQRAKMRLEITRRRADLDSIVQLWNQENRAPSIVELGTTGYYSEARGTTKNCVFLLRNATVCEGHGFVPSTVLATEFVAFRRDLLACLRNRRLQVRVL